MTADRAELAERASWVLLALGHAEPAAALLSSDLVGRLYATDLDATGRVLVQHRGVLFALVVGDCLAAVREERARVPALVATAASVTSFLAAHVAGGAPPTLRPAAAVVDAVLLAPLAHVAVRTLRRRPRVTAARSRGSARARPVTRGPRS